VHAGVFFVLEILFIRAFLFSQIKSLQNNSRMITVPISVLYGGALELMQEAVFSERSADILDFIANSFGVIVGAAVYSVLARKFSKFLMPHA
jgi:glycopeptide antibiotics resistance protein